MSLSGCVIGLAGTFTRPRTETITAIESNGGKFSVNVTRSTTHLICTKDELDKFSSRVMLAVKYNVPIVAEAWVTDTVSDGNRRNESNYLLQVDVTALEHKFKEVLSKERKKGGGEGRGLLGSPSIPSPIEEEEYDIYTSQNFPYNSLTASNLTANNATGVVDNNDTNGDTQSITTYSSSVNTTPSTTPSHHTSSYTPSTHIKHTPNSQRSSKRQRIAKDYADMEIKGTSPRPTKKEAARERERRKRAASGQQSTPRRTQANSDDEDYEGASSDDEGGSTMEKDVQFIKREIQYIKKELQSLRNDVTEVLHHVSKPKIKKDGKRKKEETE